MIQLTTKTIINFLPLSGEVKLDLLEKYDKLSREEQLRISDVVWQAYYSIYDIKIKENFDKAIAEAEMTGHEPDKTFYGKVVEETDREIEEKLASSSEIEDLATVRKSMELIVREINAAKKENKNVN